jgi:hypothetical protein
MSKQQSAVTEDLHLAVVTNPVTGLFHGAIYRNIPTPSGCNRFLLAATTKQGYATQRSAAVAINNQCLDLSPIDLSSIPEEIDEDIDHLTSLLPKGAFLTHITPREKGTVMEDDVPGIEVRPFDSVNAPILDIKMTASQLKLLVARNIAVLDSSSGNDPGLYYRYDHYFIQ